MMEEHPGIETLSAYGERELSGARQARVEEHLAGCASCRADLARVRLLVDEAAALPRGVQPPDEVWRGIRTRLANEGARRSRRPRRRWIALASLAAAAAIVLFAASAIIRPGQSARTMATRAPAPRSAPTPVHVAAVDESYQGSIAELRATLDQQRGALAPETMRVLERSLAVIDTAIAEARRALAADPANPALAGILSVQYQHKVGLLQRATKLSPST